MPASWLMYTSSGVKSDKHSKAGLDASIDSGGRVFFAYTFQNSTETFAVPEQLAQWRELRAAMTSNLTTLGVEWGILGKFYNLDGVVSSRIGGELVVRDDQRGQVHSTDHSPRDLNLEVFTTHHVEGPWLRKSPLAPSNPIPQT